jgi:hypothetical protein
MKPAVLSVRILFSPPLPRFGIQYTKKIADAGIAPR